MSIFLNPTINGLLDTQLNNGMYIIRETARINGEDFGLPQAVPDTRKMDYHMRHWFMVFVTAYVTEIAYRLGEKMYVIPNFLKMLGLSNLQAKYDPAKGNGIHIPDFMRGKTVPNFKSNIPPVLQEHFIGSMVNPRSYELIPDLIKDHVNLHGKKMSAAEQQEARLLGHHMKRLLTPERYIDEHLTQVKGGLTREQGDLLKGQLKKMDELANLFKEAIAPPTTKDVPESVRKSAKFAKLTDKQFERAFHGTRWYHRVGDFLRLGAKHDYDRLHQQLKRYHKIPHKGAKAFYEALEALAKDEHFKNTTFAQQLKNTNLETLFKELQGHAKPTLLAVPNKSITPQKNPFVAFSNWITQTKPTKYAKAQFFDEMLETVQKRIMLPAVEANPKMNKTLLNLFKDLSGNKVNKSQLHRVFEGGRFWLKLPLSILFMFVIYGLLMNSIDAGIIQPMQRAIVEKRGTSKEFLTPGYLGAVPGVAAFLALNKLPFIRNLGYVNGFVAAGLGAFAVYGATTWAMFKAILAKPPKNPPASAKPTEPKPPVPSIHRSNPFNPAGLPSTFQNGAPPFANLMPQTPRRWAVPQ